MKRIGNIKSQFLTKEKLNEGIDYLTRAEKRNHWTKYMKKKWMKILNDREHFVDTLYDELQNQTYVPGKFNIFHRREGSKDRTIYASRPRDQIVDYILDISLKYVFTEKKHIIHPNAYGSIKGKGQHELRKKIIDLVRQHPGYYVAVLDTKKYYPTIDHTVMKETLKKHIKDKWLLWLSGVMIDRVDTGLALGLASSNILGHIYHAELDWKMTTEMGVYHYYRFCDDKLMFCKDKYLLRSWVDFLIDQTRTELKQTIKPTWRLVWCKKDRFEFLGAIISGSKEPKLRKSNKKHIEELFKKEERKLFCLPIDYMRPWKTWSGVRGGLKDIPYLGLISDWAFGRYVEFWNRLRMSYEYIELKRKGVKNPENQIPSKIPLVGGQYTEYNSPQSIHYHSLYKTGAVFPSVCHGTSSLGGFNYHKGMAGKYVYKLSSGRLNGNKTIEGENIYERVLQWDYVGSKIHASDILNKPIKIFWFEFFDSVYNNNVGKKAVAIQCAMIDDATKQVNYHLLMTECKCIVNFCKNFLKLIRNGAVPAGSSALMKIIKPKANETRYECVVLNRVEEAKVIRIKTPKTASGNQPTS